MFQVIIEDKVFEYSKIQNTEVKFSVYELTIIIKETKAGKKYLFMILECLDRSGTIYAYLNSEGINSLEEITIAGGNLCIKTNKYNYVLDDIRTLVGVGYKATQNSVYSLDNGIRTLACRKLRKDTFFVGGGV